MNKYYLQGLINKYGILLSVSYLINLIWIYFAHKCAAQYFAENQVDLFGYISYIPRIIGFFINVICAMLVYHDFKKNEMKNYLTVLITLFFGFIGIALFFIEIIYERRINQSQHTTHG